MADERESERAPVTSPAADVPLCDECGQEVCPAGTCTNKQCSQKGYRPGYLASLRAVRPAADAGTLTREKLGQELDALLFAWKYAHDDAVARRTPLETVTASYNAIIDYVYAALSAAQRDAEMLADMENLLRFAGQALSDSHIEHIGDWDGGDIQDALVASGLLERQIRTVPCSDAECRCAEYVPTGDRTDCYVTTPLGDRACAAFDKRKRRTELSDLGAPHD